MFAVFVGSVMIAVVGTSILFARRIARPVRRLQEGLQILGSGDLDHRIGALGRDEIGAIANSVDDMAERLQERVADLEEAHRRLEMQGEDLVRLADDLLIARDEARAAGRFSPFGPLGIGLVLARFSAHGI